MGNVVQIADIHFGEALGRVLTCVGVCAERAGRPYTPGVLAGLFGHAFESTYVSGGGEIWWGCAFEWYRHAIGCRRLGLSFEAVDMIGNNPALRPAPTSEERRAGVGRAWDLVHASVSRGIPALAWSPMSAAQRDAGLGAFCWGLIEGCDPSTREYLVHHPGAGRFRTPCDGLGEVDGVRWFHVATFGGLEATYDLAQAVREAIQDAIAVLRGEIEGADQPAPRERLKYGAAALYEWARDVESRRLQGRARGWCADWWARTRDAAAEFCAWAAAVLPPSNEPLDAARGVFEQQATELRAMVSGDATAGRIRGLARLQDEAIRSLAASV